jgi:uncharacterized protein
MTAVFEEILIYLLLVVAIAAVAWIGQWGRRNRFASYLVNGLIGISGLLLIAIGELVMVLPKLLPDFQFTGDFAHLGLMLVIMGLSAYLSLVLPFRKLLAKTVFKGLEVNAPVHTWALFIFISALVLTIFSITVFYKPDAIIESLKSIPLQLTAVLNAVSFLLFAFIAQGLWICKPFPEVVKDLGLNRISWKTVGLMLQIAVLLALGTQLFEWAITPLVDPHMRENVLRVVEALKPPPGIGPTLYTAALVGITAGIGEETLFRGLIQPVFGLIPTALLFMMIHTHYGLTPWLLELFIIGLVLGKIRQKFSTTAAIIVHSGFDFLAISSTLFHH